MNISMADRFMKEAVYHIQVTNILIFIIFIIMFLMEIIIMEVIIMAIIISISIIIFIFILFIIIMFIFNRVNYQSASADRVAVLSVASARSIDLGVFRFA